MILSKRSLTQQPSAASGTAPATAGIRESPKEPIPVEKATAHARRAPRNGVRPQVASLATGIRWSGYLVLLTSWFTTRMQIATTPPQ